MKQVSEDRDVGDPFWNCLEYEIRHLQICNDSGERECVNCVKVEKTWCRDLFQLQYLEIFRCEYVAIDNVIGC